MNVLKAIRKSKYHEYFQKWKWHWERIITSNQYEFEEYHEPHQMHGTIDLDTDISGGSVDKQVKKKRKRCGECQMTKNNIGEEIRRYSDTFRTHFVCGEKNLIIWFFSCHLQIKKPRTL